VFSAAQSFLLCRCGQCIAAPVLQVHAGLRRLAGFQSLPITGEHFSYGVCLYEMLSGQWPYPLAVGTRMDVPDAALLRGDTKLPRQLCELMRACVTWERVGRPHSIKAVRLELSVIFEAAFGGPSAFAEMPELVEVADGLNNRALSYLSLGRQERTEKAWQEALEIDPHHLEAVYNRKAVYGPKCNRDCIA
jgi:hypothetical protein